MKRNCIFLVASMGVSLLMLMALMSVIERPAIAEISHQPGTWQAPTFTSALTETSYLPLVLNNHDPQVPRVVWTSVDDGMMGVNEPITIAFDRPMNRDSLSWNLEIRDAQGCRLAGNVGGQDAIVVVAFSFRLRYDSPYTMTVPTAVYDLLGIHLQAPYVKTFTTEPDTWPPEPVGDLVVQLYRDLQSSYPDATLSSVQGEWTTTHDGETGITDTVFLYSFASLEDAQSLVSGTLLCGVQALKGVHQACYDPATPLTLGEDYFFRVVVGDLAGNVSGSNVVSGYLETLGEYAVWHHLVPETHQSLDSSGVYSDSLEGTAFIQYDTWRLAGLVAAYSTDPNAQQTVYDVLLTYVDGEGIAELTDDPNIPSVEIKRPAFDGVNRVIINLDLSGGGHANQIWENYTDEQIDLIRDYLEEMMVPLVDSYPQRYESLLPDGFWW